MDETRGKIYGYAGSSVGSSMNPPIRLAFTLISRELWAGGYNYQRNLFATLHRYRRGEITPVVFAGMAADPGDLSGLSEIGDVEVAQSNAFDRTGAGLAAALMLGLDGAAVT